MEAENNEENILHKGNTVCLFAGIIFSILPMAANDELSNTGSRSKPRFFRAGGMDQLCLEQGKDLEHVLNLDPKLWVALSCPTTGLTFDKGTLTFIDEDKDGRIRQEEVVAAVTWTLKMLRSPDRLHLGEDF
ncbi:MAG: hypothetical protein JKY51_06480, partial [Opitutaceae bacterium]|nr:hypothetical protein [Opitutaceae bacterium]